MCLFLLVQAVLVGKVLEKCVIGKPLHHEK